MTWAQKLSEALRIVAELEALDDLAVGDEAEIPSLRVRVGKKRFRLGPFPAVREQ